jgi:hypothetical protein
MRPNTTGAMLTYEPNNISVLRSIDNISVLRSIEESLQTFENERATKKEGNEQEQEEVTSEWIEDIQRKLEASINDTDGCIHRLRGLCQGLFDCDVKKKTKKEEAGKIEYEKRNA